MWWTGCFVKIRKSAGMVEYVLSVIVNWRSESSLASSMQGIQQRGHTRLTAMSLEMSRHGCIVVTGSMQ
jgi:hypothetical protein